MGFTLLDSLSSCCHVNGNIKLQSFNGKERFGVNGFLGFAKLRSRKGTALRCNKSEVAVEFLERTSPNEVLNSVNFNCYVSDFQYRSCV